MSAARATWTSAEGKTLQIRTVEQEFWAHDGPLEANRYFADHDAYIADQLGRGEVVYHYTSLEGLRGIVSGGELWASDARFLNDKLELQYALDQMRSLIATDPNARTPSAALNAVFAPGRVWQFVACLSLARDQLSQWRGYGSKVGVAIGFSRSHLVNAVTSQGGRVEECSYFKPDDFKGIQQQLEPIAFDLRKACDADGRLTNMKAQSALSKRATSLASTIKHFTFAEEREVRMTFPIEVITPRVHFRSSASALVPYLKVDLDCRRWGAASTARGRYLNHLGMIEVVVWPADADNQLLDAIDMLMQHAGSVLITRSQSPYRS